MRLIFLLAFLLFITSTASAATISGIVVDVNDNPIAGMPIESYSTDDTCCQDPSHTTTTESDGSFSTTAGKNLVLRPANTQIVVFNSIAGYYKITHSVVEGGSKMETAILPEDQGNIVKFKKDHPRSAAGTAATLAVFFILAIFAIVGLILGAIPTAIASAVFGAIALFALAVGFLTAAFTGIGDPNTASYQAIQFFTEAAADAAQAAADGGGIMPDTEQFKEWFIDFMQILVGDKAAKTVGWIHFSIIFILTFIAAQFIQKEADI